MSEAIIDACAALGVKANNLFVVKKRGRILLALPKDQEAALMALGLYQPQRFFAKIFVCFIRLIFRWGLQGVFLKRYQINDSDSEIAATKFVVEEGSVGILLGNSEHKVSRVIASFRGQTGFEVAKMAFGEEGLILIEGEARAIRSLPVGGAGIPKVLGTPHGSKVGIMRMPYLSGRALDSNDVDSYLGLLSRWLSDEGLCALNEFPEWQRIQETLINFQGGGAILALLKKITLRPAIRHGDFTPWNLIKRNDDEVLALDWEWGVSRGVPGFDLIHYLTQELRLVRRLNTSEVIIEVKALLNKVPFSTYLEEAGWGEAHDELFAAAIAYSSSLISGDLDEMLAKILLNQKS